MSDLILSMLIILFALAWAVMIIAAAVCVTTCRTCGTRFTDSTCPQCWFRKQLRNRAQAETPATFTQAHGYESHLEPGAVFQK